MRIPNIFCNLLFSKVAVRCEELFGDRALMLDSIEKRDRDDQAREDLRIERCGDPIDGRALRGGHG
jgi:hypothetical protein